jgi:UDP-N-acetylglucosamine--N-acetylmuramyl-(pentapeptide) pyrophosphoryl-undecaprenol N-acetylglucosamine transferase
MVLVPLCGAGTRGDQVENAAYFEKRGAAFSLAGEKADAGNFADAIGRISYDKRLRTRMAAEAALLGAKDSTRLCTDLILERLGGQA